jgi:hypothetical protein
MFAMPMGGSTCVPLRMFVYGDDAAAVVARVEPVWQAWLNQQFASSGETAAS